MSNGSNIKRYKVAEDYKDYEVTLEVDHSILTPERATMINEFWSNDDWRLGCEDGDPVKAVIRLFGSSMIQQMLAGRGSEFTEKSNHFGRNPGPYWTEDLHNEEGWGGKEEGSLFGWCGIRCVAASVDVTGFDDVELTEVGHEA